MHSTRSQGASDESACAFGCLDLRTKGPSGFRMEGLGDRHLDLTPGVRHPLCPIKPSMGGRFVRLQCPTSLGNRCRGGLTLGLGAATHPESMDSCRSILHDSGTYVCPLRRFLESNSMGLSVEHCRSSRNRAPLHLEHRPHQRRTFSHIITASPEPSGTSRRIPGNVLSHPAALKGSLAP